MKIRSVIAILAIFGATPVSAETLNNDSVLALIAAGLGDEVVVAKIKTTPGNYDLSTASVIALKEKGVSGAVLAAMITASSVKAEVPMSLDSPDPLVPHPSGIYLSGPEKMTRIESTTTRQARTSGLFGYALTGGLASLKVKAAVNGPSATVVATGKNPVFYFYFDQTAQGLGAAGGSVTSPNEFSLINFETKKDKREAVIGSASIGGAKTGLRDKDQIDFTSEQIAPGTYKVSPVTALKPGEYGFVSGIVGSGNNATFRVFDFGIR